MWLKKSARTAKDRKERRLFFLSANLTALRNSPKLKFGKTEQNHGAITKAEFK